MYLVSVILQNLVIGTQILILAVSLYFVYASSKTVHIAAGTIGTLPAYIIYFGLISNWPVLAILVSVIAVVIFLGLGSAKLLEPFAARKEPLLGIIVSIALALALESVISIFFGSDGKDLSQGVLPVINIGSLALDLPGVITILLGAFLAFVAWLVVSFTKSGRLLRGVSESSELSTSLGINNKVVRVAAHLAAVSASSIVVILIGWHTALTPLMGFNLAIISYMAMLIGGGDLRGIAIASYILALVPGILIAFSSDVSENWRLVIVFVIAAVSLVLRPDGMFAKKLRES